MPRRKPRRIPSYRLHKPSGKAVVRLNGRDFYLGDHGTPESREAYDRLIAEWLGSGRRLAAVTASGDLTILELTDAFFAWCQERYVLPDGRASSEVNTYKQVIGHLVALYGSMPVGEFGGQQFKAVRTRMVGHGWARQYVNKQASRLRTIFRWGVEHDLVSPETLKRVESVRPLRRGETEAPEAEPVRSVPEAHVEAVKPHVSRQVWALIQLQLLTAARPDELCRLRAVDLDTSGTIWTYTPEDHKTAHHGKARVILLGPRAQEVVKPFLAGRPVNAYLFSPREAEAERRAAMHAKRRTPLSCGNKPGSNRKPKPKRAPRNRYDVASYRRAIARACKAAGVPKWFPYQLRHNAATLIRREYGIDVAQTILGHELGSKIVEVYAEASMEKAKAVIAKVG